MSIRNTGLTEHGGCGLQAQQSDQMACTGGVGFHLDRKQGAESGEKLKNKWIHGTGCNMQIWDEISSDLPSITLGHVVWGCKEAMAPQPLWSTVDFREGSSVHRSFSASSLPSDWSQSGAWQFAEPKPPRLSGFWDTQLWKELSTIAKNKQTNRNPNILTSQHRLLTGQPHDSHSLLQGNLLLS